MSLRNRVSDVWRRLPGTDVAEAQFRRVEATLLRELKARLERIESPAPGGHARKRPPVTLIEPSGNARERLDGLLQRAATQTRAEAEDALYVRILQQLLPDEVLILAALSDGSPFPLLHTGLGAPIGPVSRRVVENFSNIGKYAHVQLRDQVPRYIGHLRALGLVEEGSELKDQDLQYQILEGDGGVRAALQPAMRGSRLSPRYIRRSLRITPLGAALWAASHRAAEPAS